MKKIILSLTALTLLSLFPMNTKNVKAEDLSVQYVDNLYNIYEIQDSLSNYFLGDSIYRKGGGVFRLKNSLKLKNPSTNCLTFYFKFSENILDTLGKSVGDLFVDILKEDGSSYLSIADQLEDEETFIHALSANPKIGYNYILKDNILMFQVDTSKVGDYLILCGDDYSNKIRYFQFNVGDSTSDIHIEQFMLYGDTIENFSYVAPQIGLGKNSPQVFTNGDTYNIDINYDNRLELDEILSHITAYDYNDDEIITPIVSNDTYSNAIKGNDLGTYTVDLTATDKASNSTTITLKMNIYDSTAPEISGNNDIVISYTAMPSDKKIDLSKYIQAYDNHDGVITLPDDKKYFYPTYFTQQSVNITFQDSSGNTVSDVVKVLVTDDVKPTITGPTTLSYYQYEISSATSLLSNFTFDDGEGSGIKKSGVLVDTLSDNIGNPGTYDVTLYADDYFGNRQTFTTSVSIKDGTGPVFFINVETLSVSASTKLEASEVVSLMMKNGMISQANYTKVEYMNSTYQNNYDVSGTYDTQIVAYKKDGTSDHYIVSINVVKQKKTNFFVSLWKKIVNFFKNVFQYIRNIFAKN